MIHEWISQEPEGPDKARWLSQRPPIDTWRNHITTAADCPCTCRYLLLNEHGHVNCELSFVMSGVICD